jgi:glycosyltransferase involved in cell wall biosynthesis
MRIVLLTTALARGGAETQVAQVASGLRRRGHEASIVSLTEPRAFTDAAPVYSLRMREGVPNPLALGRLALLLRRLRPLVLHSHMFHANVMARLVRVVCPVPLVVSTLHSIAESGRTARDAGLRDVAYHLTDPWCDVTVAVSKPVADRHASARAVPRSKLRVIPNGIDTSRFRPGAGGGPEFTWLAVGRLMWKKDYATLLRAFEGLPGVLLIAGEGPQEAELRAMAGPNVRFLGAREDVPELMRSSDGFVMSSLVEGLPMALLEAAASGLPSVATDVGGVREVLPAPFVVPPGDAAALRAAMARVMAMPTDERREIGESLRALALARFDIESVVTQWEELYRSWT